MRLPRDDAFKRKLARVYMEEKCQIQRNDPMDFTDEELEQFYIQALMLEIVSVFTNGGKKLQIISYSAP